MITSEEMNTSDEDGVVWSNKRQHDTDDDDDDLDSVAPPLERARYYGEHRRAVSSVALAPSRVTPRRVCVSASADGTAKLWNCMPEDSQDMQGPLTPLSTLIGHSRGINDVTWSPTSAYVATASDDKTCRLWDVSQSEALVEFRGHLNFCFAVKFNPSSNLVVTGSFDETVKLWDARTGDCISTIPAHSDPVTSVDFNRDGTCVVSGSHDGLVRIWDTATGECLKTTYAPTNPPVSHVQYSPNGEYVLVGTLDSKLRLWKASMGGTCCKTYTSPPVVNTKYCIKSDFLYANPERRCIVTGSETGQVVLYDVNSRKTRQVLEGHLDAVLAVAAHDSQELIATGGMTKDKTVRFWTPGSGEKRPTKKAKPEE